MKSSSADWTVATSGSLPCEHAQPPPHTPLPCHQATVAPSSHGPGLSCGFIIGCDGKQNHHRMKDGEKGGKKASYKIHADLQIEKVREREEEDSPLTKPLCSQNTAPPQQREGEKKKKNSRGSLRERVNRPVIIFVGICG